MRWLVEVIALGKTETESLHVDAESWQKALQAARSQRGESAPMSGFSIELLDNGCRAIDPMSRLRYDVRRAPQESISPSARPPSVQPAAVATAPPPPVQGPALQASPPLSQPAPASQVPRASRPPRAAKRPTASVAPPAAATPRAILEPAAVATAPPPPILEAPLAPDPGPAPSSPRAEVGLSVPSQVIFKREQDATDSVPLTYREYVFLVPSGTTEQAAEALLRTQLEFVLASLSRAPAGKLVNLGVFDVAFQGKPPVPPLSTLMWKDWRGAPTIEFPRRRGYIPHASVPVPAAVAQPLAQAHPPRDAPSPASAPLPAPPIPRPIAAPVRVSPPVAAASVVVPPPVVAAAPAIIPPPVVAAPVVVPPPVVATAPAIIAPPVVAAPVYDPVVPQAPVQVGGPAPQSTFVPAVAPPDAAPPPPQPRARVPGEELIADLFESMHELHFLRDAVEGGDFCLNLAMEKIPSQAGIVHLYDINRREFLVTSTRGPTAKPLLLRRHSESDVLLSLAMGKRRALVFADATQADAASLERYVVLGGIRSLIVAPVMQSGRFLGAIELLNPLDGQPYTEAEGNALTYIAEQFAEFVATRGVVTDPARISSRPS